ncbi:ATP-binding protein [Spirillospora albida]|uniref:ATP-binding protein n=1 Tax=Spirillospora albida TaxID=58123 RepID=UPI0004C10917|nr:ATP-binding protein [Spirillospora albida]
MHEAPNSGEMRMTLLAVGTSVVLARELVRYALANWGYSRALIDDAVVVMSEIVTNAVNAAPSCPVRVRVAVQSGAPLLECWDPAPELPQAGDAEFDALSGRGLAIIAAYSKDTGVRPSATGEGKIVWALMPTEGHDQFPP